MTRPATSPWGRGLRTLLGAAVVAWAPSSRADSATEIWKMIGPQSATVFAGARDPSNPDLMMVGTYYGGIYRSFDGGFIWEHLQSDLSSAAIFAMRADPSAPGTFYAGAFERGVYRTTDGGGTWTELNNGLTNKSVVGIAVNPFDNQELLATTFAGIFYSHDGGANWNSPGPTGANPAIAVLFSGQTDGVCYAGKDRNQVLRSTDSGVTWNDWGTGLPPATTGLWLEPDPDDPATIYLTSDKGIFRRSEGDPAWTNLNFNLPPDVAINHVAFHVDGRVFIATEVGVFVLEDRNQTQWFNWRGVEDPSRFVFIRPFGTTIHLAETEVDFRVTINDGVSFANAGLGIQNNFPDALASVPDGSGSLIFAGSDLGVSRKNGPDVGPSPVWFLPETLEGELILKLRPDPNDRNILFAGTERAGVWRTNDKGITWVQKSDGITPNTINSIAQSPVGDHLTYAGSSTGLFISEDGGQTWRFGPEVAIPSFVSAVEADAAAPDVAYFGTNFGEILVTVNGGLSFQSSFDLPDEPVVRIASARFRDVFAVMASGRVFSSADQGMIWSPKDQEINHPASDLDFTQPRPWVGYLATLGGGVYRTESEGILWTQVNTGITNPFLFSIVVDRQDENTVYAGAVGKVYKTTNQGANWSPKTNGLPADGKVTDLAIDAGNSNRIYASVLGHGIYLSEDGGDTWVARGTDERFQDSRTVPLAPAFDVPGRMFAGSRLKGLFKSDDQGQSWQESSTGMTDLVRALQVSYQDSNRVFAGTLNSGMFRSTDGGESWSYVGLEGRQIIHSAINRFNGDHVYAATINGLVATFDGGDTWQDLGQRQSTVLAFAVDPTNRDTLFTGGQAGQFFRSADSGRTTVAGGSGLPQANILSLWSGGGGQLYAGMGIGEGVYRSTDNGDSWTKVSSGQFSTERTVSVLFDEASGELFAAGDRSGLFRSDANGTTWTAIPTPGGDQVLNPVSTLLADPFDPDHLALARLNQSGDALSLHFSPDRGVTWNTVGESSGLPTGSVWTVAFAPHTEGLLIAGHQFGIYRSTDGGQNWNLTYIPASGFLNKIQFDPDDPDRVYAANIDGGIVVSSDGGNLWSDAPTEPADLQVSAFGVGSNGRIHAATFASGVITTRDDGESWTPGLDPELASFGINFVAIDPANPHNIYVATSSEGVLKSEDGGFRWTRKNNGLEGNLAALSLIIDPLDPDTLYLGTITNGVYVSEDAGESWSPLGQAMFHELVIALVTDAADHRTVYAGAEGGGVYQLRRAAKERDPGKDFDRDGIITIVEEFMGLDPLSPNPPGLYEGGLDRLTNRYELRWQESVAATGITATPEWSPNLVDWYESGDGPGGTGPLIVVADLGVHPAGFRVKEAYLNAPPGTTRFLRLSLTR